jgi:hypothetical protein
MGAWYWIGVFAGIGVAIGILVAGIYPRAAVAAVVAAVGGAALAFGLHGWVEAIGGGVGGLAGGFGAAPVAAGALRRGGTRLGIGGLMALAAIAAAALAFVPILGYFEVILMPALAIRVRRQTPERYAGLRTLARD